MAPKIGKHDIERLFAHMGRLFGSTFADKWSDVDADDDQRTELKATWRNALADITPEQFTRGVQALFNEKMPPDLPRFRSLCQNTMANTSTQPMLTGPRVLTPRAEEELAKINACLQPIRDRMSNKIERPKQYASEAVVLPSEVPSPHIYGGFSTSGELVRAELARIEAKAPKRAQRAKRSRVPGEDDEIFEQGR